MAVGVLQNIHILNNFKYNKQLALSIAKRRSTVPQSVEAVLLDRNITEAICAPQAITFTRDMIGPPHPVSNLRPIVWYRSAHESHLKRKLRDFQEATQSWNQRFWETHNSNFKNERKMYIEKHLPIGGDKQTLTADEMSGFYKEFLDKNWRNHATYNIEWYKKNFTILFLSIAANIERLFLRS